MSRLMISRIVSRTRNSLSLHLKNYRYNNDYIRSLTISKDNNNETQMRDINDMQLTNDDSNKVDMIDVPGVKTGGDKFIIVYTCKICDTRSAKKISKQGYNKGVVLVRCGKCQNLHLIADHLGVFEDKGWDIQKYLAQSGENVNVVTDDNVLELTPKDILGK